MKSLFILIALSVVSIVIKAETKKVVIPKDIKYSIISKNTLLNEKRSLEIRINKRVSKNVLRDIALKLKAQENKRYKRTFITYHLPNMELNSYAGCWASTHFNPNLEVKVYGLSKEDYEKVNAKAKSKENKDEVVIGNWIDRVPTLSSRITIYQKGSKIFLRRVFKDESSSTKECVKYRVGNQERIKISDKERLKEIKKLFGSNVDLGKNEDFFHIDKNGYLWHGDADGLFRKCEKL